MMRKAILLMALILTGIKAKALGLGPHFDSIDGGTLTLSQWRGQPILVVNTASKCAISKQYSGLQAPYDDYRDLSVLVLAVPSNDFRQELQQGVDRTMR
tara:strand:+ start:13944 stop:14240 length:297 start_codon:yes stop_codon:yes gene_type:complete